MRIRLLSALLVPALAALALVACSNGSTNAASTTSAPTASAAPPPAAASVAAAPTHPFQGHRSVSDAKAALGRQGDRREISRKSRQYFAKLSPPRFQTELLSLFN